MTGPYAEAAAAYWQTGWRGIVPLPHRRKKNPPSGYTGEHGIDPSYADIDAWATGGEGAGNIALRLPRNIIGLDVDAYGDKLGAATITTAEQHLGPLPPTWRTTSRDDGTSGIRLFRVPEGLAWPGEIGPGTEIIQHRHRYAIVWPSLHPEGRTYRWINPDGITSTGIPDPDELPLLPDRWIEEFTGGQEATETARNTMAADQTSLWVVTREGAGDRPCTRMAKVTDQMRHDLRGSAHNAARDGVLRSVRLADEGHRGLVAVITEVRDLFIGDATSPNRKYLSKTQRTETEALEEWSSLLNSAVNLVTANPSGIKTCDCDGQITGLISGTSPVTDGTSALAVDIEPLPATQQVIETEPEPTQREHRRLRDGASFILDAPDKVPAVWGDGDEVLWAEGEALMIVGPPGVGKTTLCGQLLRALLGLSPAVLGVTVRPASKRVLYLAMDRPAQISRALRRIFNETDRGVLAEKLNVWEGPPPGDVARHPDIFVTLANLADADIIIVDSLKDAAIGLTEDEIGASYNRARQNALANGIQVLELHHLVKRGPNGAKPTTLADVYGSAWLTAGAGSVLLLWGAAGDPIVELSHLKQPAVEVGPWRVLHDHQAGTSTVHHGTDLLVIVASRGASGMTASEAARALFDKESPTPSETEKARRKLDKLVEQDHLSWFERPNPEAGGRPARVYRSNHGSNHGATTRGSAENPNHATTEQPRATASSQVRATTVATTPTTRREQPRTPPPVKGGVCARGAEHDQEQVECVHCGTTITRLFAETNRGCCGPCALRGKGTA